MECTAGTSVEETPSALHSALNSLIFFKYICLDFIQGACTESLDGQVQGAITHPPHPWSLWLVNHFPQAQLVVLWLWVTALIWLAYAFWHKTPIKVTKSPLHTPLVFKQNKEATHPRIGLGLGTLLTPSKMPSPLVFFRLHWLEHRRFKRKLSKLWFSKITQIYICFIVKIVIKNRKWSPKKLLCPFSEEALSTYQYLFINLLEEKKVWIFQHNR